MLPGITLVQLQFRGTVALKGQGNIRENFEIQSDALRFELRRFRDKG